MGRIVKPSREKVSEMRKNLAQRAASADLPALAGVREMRNAIGFTQADFARMTRLTVRQLAEIESGKGNPTLETLTRIGKVFGFRVGFIPKAGPDQTGTVEPSAR